MSPRALMPNAWVATAPRMSIVVKWNVLSDTDPPRSDNEPTKAGPVAGDVTGLLIGAVESLPLQPPATNNATTGKANRYVILSLHRESPPKTHSCLTGRTQPSMIGRPPQQNI